VVEASQCAIWPLRGLDEGAHHVKHVDHVAAANADVLRDDAEDLAFAARLRGGTEVQRFDKVKLRDGTRLFPTLVAIRWSSLRLRDVRATP